MPEKLQERVRKALQRHRMLEPGDRVGVAVSGGADSVALLLLLEELRSDLGITLAVMHFNHQLRGESAEADEQFVRELAASRGLEPLVSREDVAGRARQERLNLEEAARKYRYVFFARAIEAGQVSRVAVAHTADDQAETVLARLMRGTGPLGLAGIYPIIGGVIRPLLEVRRQELRDYLASRGQAWREDLSNRDTTRLRARIRERLLPVLETEFAPATVAHLVTLAELVRADEAFWNALTEDRLRALAEESPAGFAISIPDLLRPLALSSPPTAAPGQIDANEALIGRLVRGLVEKVKGDRRQLTAEHVAQVIRLARESSSGHRLHLPGGVVVKRSFEQLIFKRTEDLRDGRRSRGTTPRRDAYSYRVDLPQQGAVSVRVAEIGKRFRLKAIDWPLAESETRRVAEALDAERLRPPLVLRNWQPGDAYRPKGHRHSEKVKRLFLEKRIPAQERSHWPVLTSAGRLAWAKGLPAAEEFAARAETRIGLLIQEEAD